MNSTNLSCATGDDTFDVTPLTIGVTIGAAIFLSLHVWIVFFFLKSQSSQSKQNPHEQLANFFQAGDKRGPAGSLKVQGHRLDPACGATHWFAIFRPTNKEAIAKMVSGEAVGKGLNVKGKSAKKGCLSGFVPFLQISENKHKDMIEQSPSSSQLKVYFQSEASRDMAFRILKGILTAMQIDDEACRKAEDYKPEVWGIDLPELLLQEAWIQRPDISPVLGWETGRKSEPAYMNMNLQALRGDSEPQVVLLQSDNDNPMNPLGLLMAYAEKSVKPVVSDFDTFTIGSKGMDYSPLPDEQASVVEWALKLTFKILENLERKPWTSHWFELLEMQKHPAVPKYGFGDPTSCALIGDLISETSYCGAVRHAAESFNYSFPQDLDDEFLVVWEGFPDRPWQYVSQEQVRKFLMDRIKEDFIAPLNPVWLVRDKGWYEVFTALKASPHAEKALACWYPPQAKILELIEEGHTKFPEGFPTVTT